MCKVNIALTTATQTSFLSLTCEKAVYDDNIVQQITCDDHSTGLSLLSDAASCTCGNSGRQLVGSLGERVYSPCCCFAVCPVWRWKNACAQQLIYHY